MYRLRLGLSVKGLIGEYDTIIKEMSALAFDSIDIVLCECGYEGTQEQIALLKERIQKAQALGLQLNNIHLPYGRDWDISISDDALRKIAVDNVKSLIAWGDKLVPYCYVFHPSAGPVLDKDRAKRLADLQSSMKELQAYTSTPLAVENMPRTGMLNTSNELLQFAQSMGKVDYCIDVNHFLRETPDDALNVIGKYAITLHISDHDYGDEKHWLPGKGKIEWQKVIAALEKVGYQGVWNYELRAGEYTCLQDVKDNFEGLFAEYNG